MVYVCCNVFSNQNTTLAIHSIHSIPCLQTIISIMESSQDSQEQGPLQERNAKEKSTRKKFFTMDEQRVIQEMFAERKEWRHRFNQNIRGEKVTNIGKKQKWNEIADAVNSLGVDRRSGSEVKSKWKDLVVQAKSTPSKKPKMELGVDRHRNSHRWLSAKPSN